MTTSPELLESCEPVSEWEETSRPAALADAALADAPLPPRFAAQRARAARIAQLPQRRLLNRARFVSDTHRRREESEEQQAFSY
jgi:hypothetical protein